MRPVRQTALLGQLGHGRVVVQHRDVLLPPMPAALLCERIARIRRPSLHRMDHRLVVAVGLQANAHGVEQQARAQPDRARHVGVAACDELGAVAVEPGGDLRRCGQAQRAAISCFQQVLVVVERRAVAQVDVVAEAMLGLERTPPGELRLGELCVCVLVRRAATPGTKFQHLTLVVASQRQRARRHEPLCCLAR